MGAAEEDQADAEREHGEREQHEDDFRLCLLGELGADLGADSGADGDADGGNPDDVVEHEVADDAEGGGAGQHEVARGRRDVDREAEQVDHQRYVDDATADAEDARDEADAEAGDDAERAVVLEVFRHIHGVGDGLMGGVPIHDDGHQQQEYAKADVLMLSDGDCRLSEAVLQQLEQAKQQLECRVYSVLCNGIRTEDDFSDEVVVL